MMYVLSIYNTAIYNTDEPEKAVSLSNQTVSESSTVEIKCKSESVTKWTFDETNVPSNAQPAKARKKEKHVPESKISNRGTYACLGKDDNVPFTGNGELNVQRMFHISFIAILMQI